MDKIILGNHEFETLVAISEKEQEKGLMHQAWPPPVMIFPYKRASIRKFWMKNTPSPLDIVFCRAGVVVQVCEGKPHSTELVGPNELVDLVAELPYGTCSRLGIKQGTSAAYEFSVKTAVAFISGKPLHVV